MELGIVILAAGRGTRMQSTLPKVLHQIAGKPMLLHVIETAQQLSPVRIVVVYGYGGEIIRRKIDDRYDVVWVKQIEPLGTAHAVAQALPAMKGIDKVLVLYGDIPLIKEITLRHLIQVSRETDVGLITVNSNNPDGYGRIVRDKYNQISHIIEHKDASILQRQIKEINVGIMMVSFSKMVIWLKKINNNNAQGEFYLTDLITIAVKEGSLVTTIQPSVSDEIIGVNNRIQLAKLERIYQKQKANEIMLSGVTLADPTRFDMRGTLITGKDVDIDINVIFEEKVILGDCVSVGANSVLRECTIGCNVTILENCIIEEAIILNNCCIGPFTHIRPGTKLSGHNRIGNFVELKNTEISNYSKVSHLSYIGDTVIGKNVNIGAGTITCNYDSIKKHKTIIGNNVFIGSDTQLIAPVTIGDGATIGAGSTITYDAPANKLTLSRVSQKSINNWKPPLKRKG